MIMSLERKRLQIKLKHVIPIYLRTFYAKCTSWDTASQKAIDHIFTWHPHLTDCIGAGILPLFCFLPSLVLMELLL